MFVYPEGAEGLCWPENNARKRHHKVLTLHFLQGKNKRCSQGFYFFLFSPRVFSMFFPKDDDVQLWFSFQRPPLPGVEWLHPWSNGSDRQNQKELGGAKSRWSYMPLLFFFKRKNNNPFWKDYSSFCFVFSAALPSSSAFRLLYLFCSKNHPLGGAGSATH